MIISARECHYFADTELCECVGGQSLKLRGIVYSTRRYYHSLSCHQPWVRGSSAYCAGIGQGNCRILIGRDRQLARASAFHGIIVCLHELWKVHPIGALNIWYK